MRYYTDVSASPVVLPSHLKGVDPARTDGSCAKEVAVRGLGYWHRQAGTIGLLALRGTRLPSFIDLLDLGDFGLATLIHQAIAGHTPHLLLDREVNAADVERLEAVLSVAIDLLELPIDSSTSIGLRVTLEAPIIFRHDGLVKREVLDAFLAPALNQARRAQQAEGRGRQPCDFTDLREPDATMKRIPRVVVWAGSATKTARRSVRTNASLANSSRCSIARLPSSIADPPTSTSCTYCLSTARRGATRCRIVAHSTSSDAYSTKMLSCSSSTWTARRDDPPSLLSCLAQSGLPAPARLFVQTPIRDVSRDISEGGEPEAIEHENDDEDTWTELLPETLAAARIHLAQALTLSVEHAFYTDPALVLDRNPHGGAKQELLADYRAGLAFYARQRRLSRVVLLSCTSGEGSPNSIRRQKALLQLLAPPELQVIDATVEELAAHHAVPFNALDRDDVTNALVLFTSTTQSLQPGETLP